MIYWCLLKCTFPGQLVYRTDLLSLGQMADAVAVVVNGAAGGVMF